MKTKNILVTILSLALLLGTISTNVFAADINKDIQESEKKVLKLQEDLKKQREEVANKEKEVNVASKEYSDATEKIEIITTKFNEAEKKLGEEKTKLANAEARLAKVQKEIKEGEDAVKKAAANPSDTKAQEAAAKAWAKNEAWGKELDEAQKELNTIKNDNYLADAQKVYTKTEKEYKDIKQKLVEATKKVEETNKALLASVNKRAALTETLENETNKLDNLKAKKEKEDKQKAKQKEEPKQKEEKKEKPNTISKTSARKRIVNTATK